MPKFLLAAACFALLPLITSGQDAKEYALPLSIDIDHSTPAINVIWQQDLDANNFSVYRKLASEDSWNWQANIQPTGDTVFHDTNIELSQSYEYRVVKHRTGYAANGYIVAAIEGSIPLDNGTFLLVLDTSITHLLQDEIEALKWDLRGDGFQVLSLAVSRNDPVADVKMAIENKRQQAGSIDYIYLIGNVPVPYAGLIAPDAHTNNHLGAWPADVFYGVFSSQWTDATVNNTSASSSRNHNVPGDGKYDQSEIPEDATASIGRVDLSGLPNFAEAEVALMRQYLNKAHAFKHGKIKLPHRGLIDDNFGGFNGEAFAANGWRNFSSLLGNFNIAEADYRSTLDTAGYLWSYGCGAGSFTNANGIGSATQFAEDSLLTAFTMLFGSYFGDWDNQENLLRTPLAQGLTLTNCWAGRPNWHFHHMAHGFPIGYSTRLTQNNSGSYISNFGARSVHVALMGDPSLRMDYPKPVTNLSSQAKNYVTLTWDPVLESEGYAVFRSSEANGPYSQLGTTSQVSFTDSCRTDTGRHYYMVRPYRLDSNNSGTIYNYGLGAFDSAHINELDSIYFKPAFVVSDSTVFVTAETNATGVSWIFEDTVKIAGDSFDYTFYGYPIYAEVPITAIAALGCLTDTFYFEVTINLPRMGANSAKSSPLKVYPNPANDHLYLDQSAQNDHGHIQIVGNDGKTWKRLAPSAARIRQLSISELPAGIYYIRYFHDNRSAIFRPFVKQ